tara:strand:- start:123 stop:410 length:288 start_codon:yes stop_codon:yes gene_type:complete
MKKTNLVKKFTALSAIGAGLVIALVSPSQAKASWYLNSYGSGTMNNYTLSGPGGYYGNGTSTRIGNTIIDNYFDNYGSVSCTTNQIGFNTITNCF